MARPLIGITTYGRDAAGSYSLPACYVDAVRRAALAPGDGSDGEDGVGGEEVLGVVAHQQVRDEVDVLAAL